MQKGALVHGKVACNSQTLVRALTENSKRGPSGASRQAAALRREGVQIERGTLGEYMVDFSIYGWFPDMLPSEAAQLEDDDSDDGS